MHDNIESGSAHGVSGMPWAKTQDPRARLPLGKDLDFMR